MMVPADATHQINLIDLLSQQRPAEVRTATDLADTAALLFVRLESPSAIVFQATALIPFGIDVQAATAPGATEQPPQLKMAPWLIDTMAIIDAGRGAARTEPGTEAILETAEMLAYFLADLESAKRPNLIIGEDGRPSFATATRDFYLHLTVDAPGKITWYAESNGQEFFDEGVAFGGKHLPSELQNLFTFQPA